MHIVTTAYLFCLCVTLAAYISGCAAHASRGQFIQTTILSFRGSRKEPENVVRGTWRLQYAKRRSVIRGEVRYRNLAVERFEYDINVPGSEQTFTCRRERRWVYPQNSSPHFECTDSGLISSSNWDAGSRPIEVTVCRASPDNPGAGLLGDLWFSDVPLERYILECCVGDVCDWRGGVRLY